MKLKINSKSFAVISLLVVTIAGFVSGSQTWVTFSLAPGGAAFSWLAVTGTEGLAPLMPILIAIGAIAIALMISATVVRLILGALVAGLGTWVAINSAQIFFAGNAEVLLFGQQKLAEATGIVVNESSSIVSGIEVSIWPLIAAILGAVLALLGLVVLVAGYSWKAGGRKYEVKKNRVELEQSNDRIGDWDALSDGEDPSEIEDTPDGSR